MQPPRAEAESDLIAALSKLRVVQEAKSYGSVSLDVGLRSSDFDIVIHATEPIHVVEGQLDTVPHLKLVNKAVSMSRIDPQGKMIETTYHPPGVADEGIECDIQVVFSKPCCDKFLLEHANKIEAFGKHKLSSMLVIVLKRWQRDVVRACFNDNKAPKSTVLVQLSSKVLNDFFFVATDLRTAFIQVLSLLKSPAGVERTLGFKEYHRDEEHQWLEVAAVANATLRLYQ